MKIDVCRICGNRSLQPVLDLGQQRLTSVFPRTRDAEVVSVPLELVRCSPEGCGLVQLLHTADFDLMYGEHYGYRSGLGEFMINHLRGMVTDLVALTGVGAGDLVVDIGSNDATLLRGYPTGPAGRPDLVGIDPSGEKFRALYPDGAALIPDYFSRRLFTEHYGERRAKVVTSVAVFYDLPRPMDFMQDVHDILTRDGVWLLEQSYMPAMLEATAYDVVCHEHLEYYALRQIEWMAQRVGLKVVRAELNSVYGGSLCAVLARQDSPYPVDEPALARLRAREAALALDTPAPYTAFAGRVDEYRDRLLDFLAASRRAGRRTIGYGASTKGNVILQFCGLTERDLPCIGEVNKEKHGAFTPGTSIPIVSQEEAKDSRPDQMLVLPWIYRDGFVQREQDFLASGGKLVFPLPVLDVVG
ncbi:class I SAM-dependent methyltransferase [Streptomyces sp. NBC_01190]|uniref:class I SAM-dependent methyltransferase n=1 Tax=Streptomyces sp. NBC_01190 TaxID=2903767 RepID=UPI00386B5D36|nr:class I SAM-dependent methyltransferase [Streptomyces sp. NBC_01190]